MSFEADFHLNSGEKIPLIGYGTYMIRGASLILEVLDYALEAGYRLIDTATVYGNEADIGNALKILLPKYGLNREDIFITSKLPTNLGGKMNDILDAVQNSLNNLQTNYIDLYLIHWPGSRGCTPLETNAVIRDLTWQALVDAKNRGWLKNIGVSNYNINHLRELLENHHGVLPTVNQVEWHPLYHQQELLALCQEYNIFLQAYFSLGGKSDQHVLFNDPNVLSVSKKLRKSPAQVLLVWALQQGVGVIPKSLKKEHIIANFNFDFKIPDKQMAILNNLPQQRLAGDTTSVP